MSFSARYLPTVLLTILSLPTSLWAQAAPQQPTRASRASISGRVTIKEKSAIGVVISLRKTDQRNPFELALRATTDQDGNYRIANVPAGSYEVTPSAPAFVPSDSKEQRSKPVLVGEDENIENINFALVRGGVITGKVTDADGRPVIQQQVNIFVAEPVAPQPGQLRLAYLNSTAQTDDRGIYRVFGLTPGRYKVAVGKSDQVMNQSFGPQRSTYQQVFHPDVSDQAKATVIEVGEGAEANNVDIALGRALQTFTASGRVVDDKGSPVPNVRLGLQRNMGGQRLEVVNSFPTTNIQGDFVAEGLLPSSYGIFLLPDQHSALRVETLTFDVIDQDVSGLTLRLVPGASVSGVVVVDGENKSGATKLPELQLRAYVTNPTGGSVGVGSSAGSRIGPDGGFLVQGLPGGTVNFSVGGLVGSYSSRGFVIARIERDGVPIQRGIEIRDGEQLTGIRVVLAYGTGKLRGVVNLENSVLPNGARFYVRVLKSGQLLSLRPPDVDARGHFLIEDLPAGVYEIQVGVTGLPQGPPRNVKREFSVQDGVTTDVTITIELPQTPKP